MKTSHLLIVLFITYLTMGCKKNETSTNYQWNNYSISESVDLQDLCMLNENTGFMAGIPLIDSAIVSNIQISNPDFVLSNELIINIDTAQMQSIFTGKAKSYSLYKTENGGINWQGITTPFNSGIVDIDFVNAQTGFVVTRYEGVFKTLNGGDTWTKILSNLFQLFSNYQVANCITNIEFINENIGIAYQNNNESLILKTQDGGQSWQCLNLSYPNQIDYKIEPTIIEGALKQIYFNHQNQTGYMTCFNNPNVLYKSTDNGTIWEEITKHEGNAIFQNNKILLLTSNQLSQDGGNKWDNINIDMGEYSNIGCLSEDDTYYHLNVKQFYYQNLNSNEKSIPMTCEIDLLDININKIEFIGSNLGFAIGSKGTLLRYTK